LQRLAEEKEWLLNEVNYRVKQNLHTINCLLESQADSLQNDAQRAVENSRHRIHAMSLLHQKLYQSDIAGYVEMSRYLPEFIRYLDESFDAHYRIEFKLDIRPVKLGIPQAIPVALIINEAVTNSIKYAFPEKAKGVITISMHQQGDLVKLVVADSGIGFDEPPARNFAQSLGLKLMKGLSEDINASVRWENTDGARITLEFLAEPLIESPALPEKLAET
jgi:two-component system, sensor histidine kinase PdtaS